MHKKIVLLAKTKLNNIGVLISKALINSNITHEKFTLVSNILKKYKGKNAVIKNPNIIN